MIDINMTLVAQVLNFLILVLLLNHFAYKPIARVLKEREQKIANSIEKAEADEQAAKRTLAKYEAELLAAQQKAAGIIAAAERSAEETKEAQIAQTKREIERLKAEAQEDIKREQAASAEKLRGEVAALALMAAGEILKKNIDPEENKALIADFVSRLDRDKIGELSC